jgi:hypothetical protein
MRVTVLAQDVAFHFAVDAAVARMGRVGHLRALSIKLRI